jgi:hypothetical protein
MSTTQPDYYKFIVPSFEIDVIDVARGMNLSFPLALALKYFRKKGTIVKQIEDLMKAQECIAREIEYLKTMVELPF